MQKQNLPTYAIVELLIRLEAVDPTVGSYKDHSFLNTGVIVKTSGGTITFSHRVIMEQFHNPDAIKDDELKELANAFKSKEQVLHKS